ncbi:hypothetical protein ACHAWF_005861 [Thalassiosira exigua]
MGELRAELSSLVRVRDRLAQSPDSSLPKILTGLLPRLAGRIDRHAAALWERGDVNSGADDGIDEQLDLHRKLLGQASGIWAHALDRVRGGRDAIPPGALWVAPLLAGLGEGAWTTDVAVASALSMLRASWPLHEIQSPPLGSARTTSWERKHYASMLSSLGSLLDQLRRSLMSERLSRLDNHDSPPTSCFAGRAQLP